MPKKENEEGKPKSFFKHVSFFQYDDLIFDEIIIEFQDGTKHPYFCIKNNKGDANEFRAYFEYIDQNGKSIILIPQKGEELEKGGILLPEFKAHFIDAEHVNLLENQFPPAPNFKELLQKVQEHIHKYVDISKEHERAAAWYVILTWLYDKLDTIVYLSALGRPGSGKSRFLDAVGRICYKPMQVSGCVGAAPIFRMIEKWKGTMLLNEADFSGEESKDIFKILNEGTEKRRLVLRCEGGKGDGSFKLRAFTCFCPKIIARRFNFSDSALESRCLTELMQETDREEIPIIFPPEFYAEEKTLRKLLFSFRMENYRSFQINYEQIQILLKGLDRRLAQGFSCLAALSSISEEVEKEFKDLAQYYQNKKAEEHSDTAEGRIVAAIKDILERKEPITTDKVWEELGAKESDLNKRSIGMRLKSLGGKKQDTFINGKRVLKWYYIEKQLEKLYFHYIPAYYHGIIDSSLVGSMGSVGSVGSIVNDVSTHTTQTTHTSKQSIPETPNGYMKIRFTSDVQQFLTKRGDMLGAFKIGMIHTFPKEELEDYEWILKRNLAELI